MKFFSLFTIAFITFTSLQAQDIDEQDSLKIIFKAKLLTVSEYGIAGKKTILEDIERQNARYLKTIYENFLFIRIDFNQPYRQLDHNIYTLNRDCSYYIAFNKKDAKYYRLGGFEIVDSKDFFEDLELREGIIFNDIPGNEVEEIDMHCLYDYNELSEKKKRSKNFDCFISCKEITETIITIH